MSDDYFKLPRLFTSHALSNKGDIPLDPAQAHYLGNVLRRKAGAQIRLFNGRDGEWLGTLSNLQKKSGDVTLEKQLHEQPTQIRKLHLLFSPIKKNRMDWLIEKAVELGATDFHPIITQNTEVRKINEDRLKAQIFEAAEQCERFEIPTLHSLEKLDKTIKNWDTSTTILSCIERANAPEIQDIQNAQKSDIAFLIGPEGGFTKEEKTQLEKQTTPVTLGQTILRCETAVVKALILLNP